MVTLPQDATVPQILANLKAGMHVIVGRFRQKYSNDYDIIATNNGGEQISQYQTEIKIETDQPMYFGANNPVVYHLLMMCRTLDDMNMHFKQSYLFSSRIRGFWSKTNPPGMTAEQEQALRELEENDRATNNVSEGSE
jgi:elongation factor P hydroxylase